MMFSQTLTILTTMMATYLFNTTILYIEMEEYMKEWKEIKALAHKNRAEYEYEYRMRKTYEKLLPMVDNLYSAFVMFAWGNGYYDLAEHGANECWKAFCAENHNNIFADWIKEMEEAVCSLELKKYFNEKIKNTKHFAGERKNDKRNGKKNK